MIYGFAVAAVVIAGLLEGAYLYGVKCGEKAAYYQAPRIVWDELQKGEKFRYITSTNKQRALEMISETQFTFYRRGITDAIEVLWKKTHEK